MPSTYKYASNFARSDVAFDEVLGVGLRVARNLALDEARKLIRAMRHLGIAVQYESYDQILSCTDVEQFKRWAERATAISSADELFD